MPHYLQSLGYRVGLAGKVHVLPQSAFPFESVGGFDPNCVRNPTRKHDLTEVRSFMTRDDKQPFCLVVALVEPHVPWVMGDVSQYRPRQIELPPHIADTPRTRNDFAHYLAEITYMDGQVGELLTTLQESGHSDDTLVIFTSEQGSQFPGCKWTNWETGVHTALIARWPGQIHPATTNSALVQYADMLPTLLEVAGATISAGTFDGTSFRDCLLGKKSTHREFVFGMHNNVPEGPPYPIRSVSDGTYHYITNLRPEEIYIERHLMGSQGKGELNNPYWATWLWESSTNEQTYRLVKRYTVRPREELYQTTTDPFEMDNRAADPALANVKERLKQALTKWMLAQGDPGAEQDTFESLRAARNGQHRFTPPASP